MARRFMYVSIGVLCLVAAGRLGSGAATSNLFVTPASAGVVLRDETGIVSQWAEYMLDENGQVWLALSGCWQPQSLPPLPVPISQIKFWHVNTVVTTDNVLWTESGGNWTDCGPWPGSPVAIAADSWGTTKARFR